MIADIRLLLSKEVRELLNIIAPKVVSRLSKESINKHITDRGVVRGRIDWQRTVGARTTRGNDTSIYVCSRRAQDFNLPENRVFLYLIREINEKARNFVAEDYLNLTWYAEYSQGQKWVNNISVIAAKTARILRNPFISKIGSLHEVTGKAIELTRKNRQSHYKELAAIAARFNYCQSKPISFLMEELNGNIFEPLNKDTLYEIAVLFKTIRTALDCGWKEEKAGLIGGSSKTASTLVKDGCELKLYFQKLPSVMAKNSDYSNIMFSYGLSESLRRPDIILELKTHHGDRLVIIEVKRSSSRSYLVDGTYKLLGYLKDFNRVSCEGIRLTGFLVGWSGIATQSFSDGNEVHLYNWHNYADGLAGLLMSTH